jgi:hypothetical protein
VPIMGPFSLQCFDFDMHSYSRFTLVYEHMRKISEGQTQRQPHFGSVIDTEILYLTVFLSRNLK